MSSRQLLLQVSSSHTTTLLAHFSWLLWHHAHTSQSTQLASCVVTTTPLQCSTPSPWQNTTNHPLPENRTERRVKNENCLSHPWQSDSSPLRALRIHSKSWVLPQLLNIASPLDSIAATSLALGYHHLELGSQEKMLPVVHEVHQCKALLAERFTLTGLVKIGDIPTFCLMSLNACC